MRHSELKRTLCLYYAISEVIKVHCNKSNIVLYLENRIRYEKEVRNCCTKDETDLYAEITIAIETMEQLLKEIKVGFH